MADLFEADTEKKARRYRLPDGLSFVLVASAIVVLSVLIAAVIGTIAGYLAWMLWSVM